MSYLLNNPKLSRLVDKALEGIEEKIFSLQPKGPSTRVIDYMHLTEFKDLLDRTKSVNQVTYVNPMNLLSFNAESQTTLLQCLLTGVSLEAALKVAKIKPKAFAVWKSLAEKGIQPFYDFIEQCEQAEGLSELELTQIARSGGPKYAVELLRIKQVYEVEKAKLEAGSTSTVNTQVNINLRDRRPEDRRDIVEGFFYSTDQSNIIDLPIKSIDSK